MKVGDAERDFRASLAISRKLNGDSHTVTLQIEATLGAFLHATSRRAEGRDLLEAAGGGLDNTPDIHGSNTGSLINTLRGRILFDDGRFDMAETYIAQAVADARDAYPQSSLLSNGLLEQGEIFTSTGRFAEATRDLNEALQIRRRVGGSAKDAALVNPFLIVRARLSLAQGDAPAAIEWAHQVRPPADAPRRPLLVDDLAARIVLAQAYTTQGKTVDALREAHTVVNTVLASPLRDYVQPLEAAASMALAEALRRSGDGRAACPLLERALQLRSAMEGPASPRMAQTTRAACWSICGVMRRGSRNRTARDQRDPGAADARPRNP